MRQIAMIIAVCAAFPVSSAMADTIETDLDMMYEESERRQLEQLEHLHRHAQVQRMQQQKMEQQRANQQRRVEERRQGRYEQDSYNYTRSKSNVKEEKEKSGEEKPYFHYVY